MRCYSDRLGSQFVSHVVLRALTDRLKPLSG
jgi:hypothetical protein